VDGSVGPLQSIYLNCKPRRAARNTSAACHAISKRRQDRPPWDSELSSVGYGAGLSRVDISGSNQSGMLSNQGAGQPPEKMGRARQRRIESFQRREDR